MSAQTPLLSHERTRPYWLLAILILLGLSISAAAARAASPGPYLTVEGYGTWLRDSVNQTEEGDFNTTYKAGFGGGLALGYDLLDAHPALGRGRVEVEVASRRGSVDQLEFVEGSLPASGELTMNSLLVNTIADYHKNSRLVPYLSLGGGYAEVSIDQVSPQGVPFISSGSDKVWAYQLGAGLGIMLGDHLAVDLGYRYFGTEKPKFRLADGSNFTCKIVSHNLLVGLRFRF